MFSLQMKLIAIGVGVILIVGSLVAIRQHYINVGWTRAITDVEKQDEKATVAADKVKRTVRECYDAGGLWSQLTGECQGGM